MNKFHILRISQLQRHIRQVADFVGDEADKKYKQEGKHSAAKLFAIVDLLNAAAVLVQDEHVVTNPFPIMPLAEGKTGGLEDAQMVFAKSIVEGMVVKGFDIPE